MIDCLFQAVRTNPGYGMAALISNNLLNLISGTVILLTLLTYPHAEAAATYPQLFFQQLLQKA